VNLYVFHDLDSPRQKPPIPAPEKTIISVIVEQVSELSNGFSGISECPGLSRLVCDRSLMPFLARLDRRRLCPHETRPEPARQEKAQTRPQGVVMSRSRSASAPSSGCSVGKTNFAGLLLRLERLSPLHYAFKILAYTMIDPRHYCCS
jgi:hypothetical protein